MSRPLKLKVSGTVLCSVFQLPDHGFIGQFAGAHRRRFFPKRVGWASVDSGTCTDEARTNRDVPKFLFSGASHILFRYAVTRTVARLENGM
jgi:hypothetical protein